MTTADLAATALTSAQQLATTIGAIVSKQLAAGAVDPNVTLANNSVNALVGQIQTLQTSITDDASVISSLQQQIATARTMVPASTTPPVPAGTTQTYVSAPATMALMGVAAIVGAAGGYAGKKYLDTRKGAREVAEETARHRSRPRKRLPEKGAES